MLFKVPFPRALVNEALKENWKKFQPLCCSWPWRVQGRLEREPRGRGGL